MKIFSRKLVGLSLLLLLLLLATSLWVGAANSLLDVNSVLSGRIASSNLISIGSFVKEGTVLASIESITGETPTARATRDGVVREVLVKPGDSVRAGQVIARIEPVIK